MELNICHLYPNLLNTYGDYGNILIIKNRCEQRGIKVNIINTSVNESFDYENTDILLIGGGQDFEQSIVAKDMISKLDSLKTYVENDGVLISICGGYQLLGHSYVTSKDGTVEGLGILPIKTVAESDSSRIIDDIVIEDLQSQDLYVGFENHGGKTYILDGGQAFGKVVYGQGNNGKDGLEGVRYKNAIGTYLHGSLLSKNPKLADDLILTALKRKYNKDIVLEKLDDTFEEKARLHMFKKLNVNI